MGVKRSRMSPEDEDAALAAATAASLQDGKPPSGRIEDCNLFPSQQRRPDLYEWRGENEEESDNEENYDDGGEYALIPSMRASRKPRRRPFQFKMRLRPKKDVYELWERSGNRALPPAPPSPAVNGPLPSPPGAGTNTPDGSAAAWAACALSVGPQQMPGERCRPADMAAALEDALDRELESIRQEQQQQQQPGLEASSLRRQGALLRNVLEVICTYTSHASHITHTHHAHTTHTPHTHITHTSRTHHAHCPNRANSCEGTRPVSDIVSRSSPSLLQAVRLVPGIPREGLVSKVVTRLMEIDRIAREAQEGDAPELQDLMLVLPGFLDRLYHEHAGAPKDTIDRYVFVCAQSHAAARLETQNLKLASPGTRYRKSLSNFAST